MVNCPKRTTAVYIALTLLAGILILWPQATFQGFLSTGDHGRDLYAFEHAYQGTQSAAPYRDYWWVYGPLSPYYYGLFIKMLGAKITSVLAGQIILLLTAGLFLLLTVAPLAGPAAGFAGAVWFYCTFPDFFFTYNHTAGIVAWLALAFTLTAYIRTGRNRHAWGALTAAFFFLFIKFNQGAAALLATAMVILIKDHLTPQASRKSKCLFWSVVVIGVPIITWIIYSSLLSRLTIDEIRQCFPYTDADQQYVSTPWTALLAYANIWLNSLRTSPRDLALAVLFIFSAGRLIQLAVRQLAPLRMKKILLPALVTLLLLWLASLHEYLKSGVTYRYNWSEPLWTSIMFITLASAFASFRRTTKITLWCLLAALLIFCALSRFNALAQRKNPVHFLSHPKGQVFLANHPEWIDTVEKTSAFINENLKPGELFFTLPYDILYYYLTGRAMPTRQSIFFKHINIPAQQERTVITDLERNRVNWIVLSNRYAATEAGLGILGKDYCPLLAAYIDANFSPAVQFGNWTNEPGWAWSHGTIILKRKIKEDSIPQTP